MSCKRLNLRNIEEIKKLFFNNEGLSTVTSEDQLWTERLVFKKYEELHLKLKVNKNLPELLREHHGKYLLEYLSYLPEVYDTLDSSRPWLVYWILNALTLMNYKLDDGRKSKIAQFLKKCRNPDGGFGGGPGQYSHLASSYAAVNALVILGTEEAYNVIDRKNLYNLLLELHQSDGSYQIHKGGEIDVRAVYCALSVASLTGLLCEKLTENCAEFIISCQTYEGGFAGLPGLEAHGGYAFCGYAALLILGKGHLCDTDALLRWLVFRQMKLEGGFQGRTNKLVDGCYSFWQGSIFPMIYTSLMKEGREFREPLFDNRALQEYILICCQCPNGGLLDKPGKKRDIFHTCYTISGLSIAQHFLNENHILGPNSNQVEITHPLHNIRIDFVLKATRYFEQLGLPTIN